MNRPQPPTLTRRHRAFVTLVLAPSLSLVVAGCGDDGDDAAAPPADEAPGAVVDWSAIGTVDLGDGWVLEDGDGDAPYAAIRHAGTEVGIVELNAYPVDSLDAFSERLDEGEAEALDAHVDDFLEALAGDRAMGCGADYAFVSEPRQHVQVGDGVAIRYGFTGARASEPVSERTLQWAAIRGDVLVLINVAAYDPESCISTEGAELTVSALADAEQLLVDTIEASDLGSVVAAVQPQA